MQPVLVTTFRQCVFFPDAPPPATRRALIAAGFTFNGEFWANTRGTTSPLGMAQLDDILKAMTSEK